MTRTKKSILNRELSLKLLRKVYYFIFFISGYGVPPQPQVDPNIAQWFQAVDTDKSGHITASELQRALVNGNWSHFSEEACRMMIGETKTSR